VSQNARAQKRKVAIFHIKVDFFWRKSATKFFLCENCQRHNCKAFIGLPNRAQLVGGKRPSTRNFGL